WGKYSVSPIPIPTILEAFQNKREVNLIFAANAHLHFPKKPFFRPHQNPSPVFRRICLKQYSLGRYQRHSVRHFFHRNNSQNAPNSSNNHIPKTTIEDRKSVV